ncbi:MAG: hypothetical protein GY940_32525, partial [bacterium]|nr:hypothetical protein [bacterium]
CSGLVWQAASGGYQTPDEVNNEVKKLAGSNPGIAKVHRLATSPGGVAVNVLEIGPETGKSKKTLPAIFVAANMEGTVPISSEAALSLARLVLEKAGERKDKTWYILALGNPDGAGNYFKKPLRMDSRNNRPHNDDMDDQTDEDGVEDLDGNGIITRMRVKDPQGQWLPIPGEPRLMKKADWTKGEKGIYKLYSEGIDNDGDGKYNEDGPGGVNVGVNFPHLFKPYTKSGGPWAGSEAETYELFKFIYRRPEIAMTLYLGSTNFCMVPPRGGRKGTADFTRIKVPGMMGERMGFDPDKTYTMKEILEKAQPMMPPGMELTEGLVASFLGLGPAVNPLGGDLKFYNAISEEYKAFLKKNKSDAKRLEPARAKDGSFELWAYYHLGIPSFSLDFWTLPEVEKEKKGPEITPEKLEAMSKEDFLALGEKKIDAFLKSANAPLKAKQLMKMVEGGMMTPKKMAAMMKNMPKPKSKEGADPGEKALLVYSDKTLKGKGFVEWKTFNHPTLGEVEIGGAVPYARNTPGAGQVKTLVDGQLPWVFQLTGKLPRISIVRTRVKALGNGVYRVKAWVGNSGLIPYPTAMGTRNKRIPPVVVTLTGQNIKIIEGKKRSLIKAIGGHGVQTVEWLVQAEKPVTLKLVAHSPTAWSDTASVKLTP